MIVVSKLMKALTLGGISQRRAAYTVYGTVYTSLVPRPFFAGEGKNGLGTTVRACVGYSVKSR